MLAPFGDNELRTTLSEMSTEEANELAQQLLRHSEEGLEGLWIHAGELGILSLETTLAKSALRWSGR